MADYRIEDLPSAIAEKIAVNPVTGCWEWQASTNHGYGQVRWDGTMRQVHRVVYTLLAEPIPDDLTLDHVKDRGCASTACCWPVHLEPVTREENSRRAGLNGIGLINAAKTHCPAGHEYTPENTLVYSGRRECRTCRLARGRVENMTPEQLERHRAWHRDYERERKRRIREGR